MALPDHVERTDRFMIGFDLALGASALLAPRSTSRVLGHDGPSTDAEHLFRRCAPIWLTFAAAHATAAVRGRPEDCGRCHGWARRSRRPTWCGRVRPPSAGCAPGRRCGARAWPTWPCPPGSPRCRGAGSRP